MAVTRIFTDWRLPVAEAVADALLPESFDGPFDLEGTLLVAPTRQAGRRLRDTLARRCHEAGSVLLSAQTVTPDYFIAHAAGNEAASRLAEKAVWFDMLEKADLSQLSGLFPNEPPERGTPWALSAASMVQSLREQLLEAVWSIRGVADQCGATLEEPDRWADLAALETTYLRAMRKRGLRDRCERILQSAKNPSRPEPVRRIVIAAVPDLSPLVERLVTVPDTEIDVLVYAPEDQADAFDAWGRPIPDAWMDRDIAIPDPDRNMALAGTPEQQAEVVIRAVHEAGGGEALSRVALGALDADVLSALRRALESRGVSAYDPNPVPLAKHRMCLLLQEICDQANEDTYPAFARLMRHPDWLAFCCAQAGCTAREMLQQLDEFQNEFLPQSAEYMARKTALSGVGKKYAGLAAALQVLHVRMRMLAGDRFPEAVRKLFDAVYAGRLPEPGAPGAAEDFESAQLLNRVFREADACGLFDTVSAERALSLLAAYAAEQHIHPARPSNAAALEGWMELFWNPAPVLAAAGMNEGNVPDTRVSDVFLPDALKSRLGLQDDRRRTARDAYILQSMLVWRAANGRALFVCGKTGETGDPLKPSRLLFRCPDVDLPTRAQRLFGKITAEEPAYQPAWSVRLDPSPPDDANPFRLRLDSLSVTAFRDYLRCPFRFYLKQVLEMEELHDAKTELDALDFGRLVHHAWEAFAQDERLRHSENPEAIRACLAEAVDRRIEYRYGAEPPLPVRFARHTAVQRLSAAADIQAELARQGWEILCYEKSCRMELDGVTVRGRIDRIDRHRDDGRLLVIDYKTSDRGEPAENIHLQNARNDTPEYARVEHGGKTARWTDLQLPLYILILRSEGYDPANMSPGYFNLPKAASRTDLNIWDGFDAEWLEKAEACARAVAARIRARDFWPPRNLRGRDDFAFLFQDAPPDAVIDAAAFERYLRGGAA